MEKEREKTEGEKGREKDFTGPGSSVGSVSQGVQSAKGFSPGGLAHPGLQLVSFYHPCPSFGQAPELVRLMNSL